MSTRDPRPCEKHKWRHDLVDCPDNIAPQMTPEPSQTPTRVECPRCSGRGWYLRGQDAVGTKHKCGCCEGQGTIPATPTPDLGREEPAPLRLLIGAAHMRGVVGQPISEEWLAEMERQHQLILSRHTSQIKAELLKRVGEDDRLPYPDLNTHLNEPTQAVNAEKARVRSIIEEVCGE